MKSVFNKHATFDYEILDKFQAGLVLTGHEVKSVKQGQINLKGAFITMRHSPKPELFLTNAHISPYFLAGRLADYDPTRSRKLLVKKEEIKSLLGKLEQKGLTLVPLKVYTIRNLVKIEFGLARGKKKFEKKESKKKKDVEQEIKRTLKTQRF
ncbi:SsrA-binding protein SmpB [Patescibacteria group bacterium]|nr:SsrA-binding protein SmpB [Patescibacteria group bacterium]